MKPQVFTAAQMETAIRFWDLISGWHPQAAWMPVYLQRPDDPRGIRTHWHRCGVAGSADRLFRFVRGMDEDYSDEIHFGLPEPRRWFGEPSRVTVLVLRVEGAEQVKRAGWLKPRPSFAVREGNSSRRTLVWALEEALSYPEAEDAARKLAYRVGARQVDGVPERVRVPAPGTCLRVGRARPCAVRVTRAQPHWFTARRVVGGLKDPPARDAWRNGGGAA